MDGTAANCVSADKSLNKFLSKDDALSLLGILAESSSCREEKDFSELLKYFGSLLSAQFSLCFLASLAEEGLAASIEVLNINFPSDWLKLYMSKGYFNVDPVATEHFRNYEVQYWGKTYTKYKPPSELLRHAHRFGLRKGYSCGTRDSNGPRTASLFYFSGDALKESPRIELMLKYAVPFLHEALKTVLRSSSQSSRAILTLREKEILGCIRDGMTDSEAATSLKITGNTVKFHVKNILSKLEATSRYHAVAIALQMNII